MQNADCTSVRWQNARTSGNTIYEIKLKKNDSSSFGKQS